MRIPFLALSLFAAVGVAQAQLVETIEVRVANVDVIVTDRAGNPVPGLTKDDFEVLENGFSQPITNFYEIRGDRTEAPREVEMRRVVVFADQDSIDPRRRKDAFAAAERTLDKLLRPGDEAMVIESYRDRGIVTELTSDREAILRALREAANAAANVPLRKLARERVTTQANDLKNLVVGHDLVPGIKRQGIRPREAYYNAREAAKMHVAELANAQRRLLNAFRRTLASMAGLEGKKVAIFIGGDFQRRPGVELLDAVDDMFRGFDEEVVIIETDRNAVDFNAEIEQISRTANANGVTLYMINGYESARRGAEAAAPIDGVEGDGLDLETATTMTGVANATGGRAMVTGINYDLTFENIARDLNSYYSLGYKPGPGAGERTLVVKVKKPGLVARTRSGYTLKTSEEEINERVIANAFHPRMTSDFDVQLELGTPTRDGEVFLLPVTVHIASPLTTISDGKERAGEFAVYFVTASVNGNKSAVARDVQTFSYSNEVADANATKPVIYTGSLRVRSGEQLVSVAVVDRVGGRSGFARAKFTAAPDGGGR